MQIDLTTLSCRGLTDVARGVERSKWHVRDLIHAHLGDSHRLALELLRLINVEQKIIAETARRVKGVMHDGW